MLTLMFSIVSSYAKCFVIQVYSEQEAITAFMSPYHGPCHGL